MPSLQFIHTVANTPQVVRLFKKITTIGHDNDNDIPIGDGSVDGNHAYIVFDGKHYSISPVGKKNIVLINGKKEKNYTLTHKDVVTLGEVNITFDLFDEASGSEEDKIKARISSFQKLYELTEKLIATSNLEDLLDQFIDTVIDVTRADNGFLILRREDLQLDFTVARNLNQETIDNAIDYVSDSIISQVIQTRKPLIVSDALSDDAFANSASVLKLELASVMCVPLIARGNLLGIIYVGNNNIINLFTPDQLSVLEIFAGQASLLIQNALLLNELKLDRQNLQEQIEQLRYGSMIGSSEAMRGVFRKIDKIAPIDVPVLVQGETGTGKELVAREIHNKSSRKDGPFIVINCGAIPAELLESEMFGHVKGAFTGAVRNKMGKFKAASGGTLFLDEIGDMPLELQVKMLRALEEHTIVAVGDTKQERVDIRVVAATNIPLEKAIEEGMFREDLFYRLNVITIWLPPLRERGDDLMLIAKYFLNRYNKEYERKIKGISSRSSEAVVRHAWPGNVRELENRIKKAVIMAEKNLIEPEDLDLRPDELTPIKPLATAREEFQIRYIREALQRNNGNRTRTAQMLDVDPRTIFRYLEKMTD